MLIPLSQGQSAIVDDEDAWLLQWTWYALKQPHTFYACRDVREDGRRRTIWMHRFINGTPAGSVTDHINGNGLDNRRANLRSVTHRQNMINNARHAPRSPRYRGVSWHVSNRCWIAQITVNRRNIYIGRFDTAEDARDAYAGVRRRVLAGEIYREDP